MGDLEPVQLRHVDIQKQEVEALFCDEAQCLTTIVCQPHPLAAPSEQLLQELRVKLAVLGHQDTRRRRGRGHPGPIPLAGGPGYRRGVAVALAHKPVDRLQ